MRDGARLWARHVSLITQCKSVNKFGRPLLTTDGFKRSDRVLGAFPSLLDCGDNNDSEAPHGTANKGAPLWQLRQHFTKNHNFSFLWQSGLWWARMCQMHVSVRMQVPSQEHFVLLSTVWAFLTYHKRKKRKYLLHKHHVLSKPSFIRSPLFI